MRDNVLNKIKRYKSFVIFLISFIIFIILLISVLNENIQGFDTYIYNFVSSLKSNLMTVFFKTITKLADKEVLILIAILCLIFIKNKKFGVNIAVNLVTIGLINYILKEIIQRQRPPLELRMIEENSFSFPSGHAMASVAFYGLIIYFIYGNFKNKKIRIIINISLSILIFLIGISRIYLGVHYPSDVLAGFMFSIVYLILYITFILKGFKLKEK